MLYGNTDEDSAVFTGQPGVKYEFYSRARDRVGNLEDPPVDPENFPDAVTTIILGTPEQQAAPIAFSVSPNPFNNNAVCSFVLTNKTNIKITLTDIAGREVMNICEGSHAAGTHQCEISGASLTQAMYFIKVDVNNSTSCYKLVKQ
jgi:hypothetical protein